MSDDAGDDWLHKLGAQGWLDAARTELHHADASYAEGAARAGLAYARRAAGMALNAALVVRPREWGRTYVEHLRALSGDETAPEAVRRACHTLLETTMPGASALVTLRRSRADVTCVEAARDVIAHAYAIVLKGTDT